MAYRGYRTTYYVPLTLQVIPVFYSPDCGPTSSNMGITSPLIPIFVQDSHGSEALDCEAGSLPTFDGDGEAIIPDAVQEASHVLPDGCGVLQFKV